MKAFVVVLVALGLCAIPVERALTADHNNSDNSVEGLIASLSLIDTPAPGLAGMAVYSSFMAENENPEFQMGVLGSPPPAIPAQMRELVRRGLGALPILTQHLADKRTTNLSLGGDLIFMWQQFDDEYDPRVRASRLVCDAACEDKKFREARTFAGAYRVRIADVCFVLIGQIVNRNLIAVRYQPTGGLIVNSPIETPLLAARIRADWDSLDGQSHQASLLDDMKANDLYHFGRALRRLRFYYPNAYAALTGDNAMKREAFEAEEKKARAAQ